MYAKSLCCADFTACCTSSPCRLGWGTTSDRAPVYVTASFAEVYDQYLMPLDFAPHSRRLAERVAVLPARLGARVTGGAVIVLLCERRTGRARIAVLERGCRHGHGSSLYRRQGAPDWIPPPKTAPLNPTCVSLLTLGPSRASLG
jgi:hypothetical protein